jgi:hypothetical protein
MDVIESHNSTKNVLGVASCLLAITLSTLRNVILTFFHPFIYHSSLYVTILELLTLSPLSKATINWYFSYRAFNF